VGLSAIAVLRLANGLDQITALGDDGAVVGR